MPEERFTEDRLREILRRAIEIDAREGDSISESDLRQIAAEVGVSQSAVSQALADFRGDIVARPPSPTPALRRWSFLALVLALGAGTWVLAPQAASELVVPFVILIGLSVGAALLPVYDRRRRAATVIGTDGIRFRTSAGERLIPWSSVVELKAGIPGTVRIITPSDNVLLRLKDFGDADAVLAAVKLRIARASLSPGSA